MALVSPARPIDADAVLALALACDLDRAFESLVIEYRDRVVTFVARMLHDDARAEDVAQDVFLRAYRALASYDRDRRASLRLRSWLYAIAHNLTRNAVRDAPPPSTPLAFDDGVLRALAVDGPNEPEAAALRAESWRAIERAIGELSPALRPAFVMRYIDDLTYDEIARALDEPLGTVKSSAHRGLLAVRASLEKNDE